MSFPLGRRLLILIGGHLSTAPRPQKEAAAAIAAGFEVVVRGVWWDEGLAAEDVELARHLEVEFKPVMDLRVPGGARRFRIKQRVARELFARVGVASPRSFGLAAPEMLQEAARIAPDFTMVHSEAGLWVAGRLLERGCRVGVDFEDWFSEDLPPGDRKGRPVAALKKLEHHLLRHAHLAISTTRVMGETMAREAGFERVPLAIPNSFSYRDAPQHEEPALDGRDPAAVSFYWFSQTIGPGRGLESLARALPRLSGNWELHLRGNLRGYDSWFEKHFPPGLRDRITVHPTVSNADLPRHSASHDVGLALEVPHCPSRDLTATNKIFEYLRCGLAVIATSTKGQLEVMAECAGTGWVVVPDDEEALAAAMQACLDHRDDLAVKRMAARNAAKEVWAWERFEGQLAAALRDAASGGA